MLLKKHKLNLIFSCICLTLGMLSGSIAKPDDYLWLNNLNKPWFNPPNWIFGPVWTILYIMMGMVISKIWQTKFNIQSEVHNKPTTTSLKYSDWPIILFILQLILNLSWTPIFFHYRRIDLGFYVICLLWCSLFGLMFVTKKIKGIFWLLLPYISWVSFALILNLFIYKLNF
jgi:translocator protein